MSDTHGWIGSLGALLRAPLLHFLAMGAAGLGLAGLLEGPEEAERPVITLDAARVQIIASELQTGLARMPTPAELKRAIGQALDREVLFREALRAGLDHSHPGVHQRLVALGRYLDEASADTEEASQAPAEEDAQRALDRARGLGLVRSDQVVRAQLISAMTLAAEQMPLSDEPPLDETLLRRKLQADADRHRLPGRQDFRQVFVARDSHGEGAERVARELLDKVRALPPGQTDASLAHHGDPFLRGQSFRGMTPRRIDSSFGPGFARALAAVPLKRWSGPLPSSYGLHLVWVGARSPGRLARLEEVAPRLRAEVLREWRARRLKARLAVLRARYQIKVPALPTKVKP